MMLEFIVIVLCIAFYLYALLGGADFGAGTLELFTGNRSIKPIYKAIAPVWEVNHIWLILAVVIIFNAFPAVFAEVSTSLHIPLFIILIGIIMRGTAFTFRHYDTHVDGSHVYYHWFFRISSVLTSFFLGVTLGAMIYGKITDATTVTFAERFIAPWLNPFCLVMGAFSTSLFAYVASAFIIGETRNEEDRNRFAKFARRFLFTTFVLGGIVLFLGIKNMVPFMGGFIGFTPSTLAIILATILFPIIPILIKKQKTLALRIAVGAQVALIMAGWALAQIPVILYKSDGYHFTLHNSAAGESTLYQLTIALIIGSCLIFPGIFYLFRVFKR